jgi:hypothetical protein
MGLPVGPSLLEYCSLPYLADASSKNKRCVLSPGRFIAVVTAARFEARNNTITLEEETDE